jgi:hypothetical protein
VSNGQLRGASPSLPIIRCLVSPPETEASVDEPGFPRPLRAERNVRGWRVGAQARSSTNFARSSAVIHELSADWGLRLWMTRQRRATLIRRSPARTAPAGRGRWRCRSRCRAGSGPWAQFRPPAPSVTAENGGLCLHLRYAAAWVGRRLMCRSGQPIQHERSPGSGRRRSGRSLFPRCGASGGRPAISVHLAPGISVTMGT